MGKSRILIVDDNYESIQPIIGKIKMEGRIVVNHVSNSKDALSKLKNTLYDLMIIDLQIPESVGDEIDPLGGKKLLEYIDKSADILKPTHILGLTAHQDSLDSCSEAFNAMGWSLLKKTEDPDFLINVIQAKLRHASDPPITYDVCILTALNKPELQQILRTGSTWIPVKFEDDINVYHATQIDTPSGCQLSLLATSCNYMGLAQSSAIAMKMCLKFSPKYILMTGIAAGIEGKVKLGDILISDICWDWGNGKQTIKDGKPVFLSAPRQENIDPMLKAKLNNIITNRTYLDEIYNNWPASNRPDHALNAHIGPIATGSVILEDPGVVEMIKSQHRETIGIEMEAYGFALAASLSSLTPPKPIIIKSVCDFADPTKNNEWQDYAAYTSAQLAIKFIQNDLF